MALEYRVVWKREDGKKKTKRYATLKGAKRWMTLLGDEPWKAYANNPDDKYCCDGDLCGCGGITWKQHFEFHRQSLPKIEYIRLEQRDVGEWK